MSHLSPAEWCFAEARRKPRGFGVGKRDAMRAEMPRTAPLIAVLMTVHNRRHMTLDCLASLRNQSGSFELRVVMVDDGCTDGTQDAVLRDFPEVEIVQGTGQLFWAGGMRLAQDEALMRMQPEYLMWLNDDVILDSTAIETLLVTMPVLRNGGTVAPLVVGPLQDDKSELTTYSGLVRARRWHPLRLKTVDPLGQPRECDTMNGNIVLIPRDVYRSIGSVDRHFRHALGDLDYGLRARAGGFKVLLAPMHVGTCSFNPITDSYGDPSLSRRARLRLLRSPRALWPPAWLTFCRRYGGWLWPLFWVSPYARVLLGLRFFGSREIVRSEEVPSR